MHVFSDLGSLYIAETEKRLRQVAQENEIHQNLTDHERTEVPEVSQEMVSYLTENAAIPVKLHQG